MYMKPLGLSLLLFFCLTVGSLLADENLEIPLGKNLPNLSLTRTHYTRNAPQRWYDQGTTTLPHVKPNHVILCKRRLGQVGNAIYSMICWQETAKDKEVEVDGEVVFGKDEAWRYKILVQKESLHDALLRILEALSQLPYKKPVKLTP